MGNKMHRWTILGEFAAPLRDNDHLCGWAYNAEGQCFAISWPGMRKMDYRKTTVDYHFYAKKDAVLVPMEGDEEND